MFAYQCETIYRGIKFIPYNFAFIVYLPNGNKVTRFTENACKKLIDEYLEKQ